MIKEDEIVQNLKVFSGDFIGDDAAILPNTNNGHYVITKDLLVEDIHFRTRYFTPQDLAHKALHVNLSDLAAMGAKPLYILCGISIPEGLQSYACSFLDHLAQSCLDTNTILIGGDTTASQQHLFISITAIGIALESNIKYRKNAENGDIIAVVGNLGFAHLGLTALENGSITNKEYVHSFLRPEAKIKEGVWLGQRASVNSMMDISDGLYIDLKRLCGSSNKGAVIDLDLLENCVKPEIPIKTALEGGEDYALLFTAKEQDFMELSREFTNTFGYELKIIGKINDGKDVNLIRGDREILMVIDPFTHF